MLLLTGASRAGKSAIAQELHGWTRFAFADALKDDVAAATGLDRELFEGVAKDQPIDGQTPRDRLIKHAVATDPTKYTRKIPRNCDKLVVEDLRFSHELDYIMSEFQGVNIIICELVRDNTTYKPPPTAGFLERLKRVGCRTINNNTTIADAIESIFAD